MRKCAAIFLAFLLCLSSLEASAQDDYANWVDDYGRLLDLASASYDDLNAASEEYRPALRDAAGGRVRGLLDWLDGFLESNTYAELSPNVQAGAVEARYTWEYNLSLLLIEADRCEEARDRTRSLLDSPIDNPELRPRLTEAFTEAVDCLTRERTAILVMTVTPPDAQVYVDGVLVGLASAELDLPLGPATVTVSANGYVSETRDITANEEGERVDLGRFDLLIAEMPGKSPTWYEWSLWGVGAAGIGTSVALFIVARGRESTVNNPPDGKRVEDLQHEIEIIDDLDTVVFVAGALGIVSIVTGTVLYSTREPDQPDGDIAWYEHLEIGPTSFVLTFDF